MKSHWSLLAVALQVTALAYLAGEREWILLTGRTIHLRTAPVDPRDAMRGDYVRPEYDISRVPRSLCRGVLADTNAPGENPRRGTPVFAVLRENESGLAELVDLTDTRPTNGLYLRGRTERSWWGNVVPVQYGLEAFFLEQGKGAEIEQRRSRDGIQIPLEMAVAANSRGIGVLKGHCWGPLGCKLELESVPDAQDNRSRARRLVAAKVLLLNASSNDLVIVDLPRGAFSGSRVKRWAVRLGMALGISG